MSPQKKWLKIKYYQFNSIGNRKYQAAKPSITIKKLMK